MRSTTLRPETSNYWIFFSTQKRQQIGAFALDLRRRAGVVKSYDCRQRCLEFLPRFGVVVVQGRRFDLPTRGDGADRQSIVKTQTQQLDAAQGGRTGATGVVLLTLC